MDYLIYNKDDSPLYLFESSIENHKDLKSLIDEYSIPEYFTEDFFEIVKNLVLKIFNKFYLIQNISNFKR